MWELLGPGLLVTVVLLAVVVWRQAVRITVVESQLAVMREAVQNSITVCLEAVATLRQDLQKHKFVQRESERNWEASMRNAEDECLSDEE